MPSQPRSYSSEGIILRHMPVGEADRIVSIFSPVYGKIRAAAKGSRKVTSALAGSADVLVRSDFAFARGRELDIMTQAVVKERFEFLRDSPWHGAAGLTVVECIDRSLEDGYQFRAIYALTLDTLRRLNSDAEIWLTPSHEQRAESGPNGTGWAALRYFELRLMDLFGYRPEFTTCVNCGAELFPTENNGFNAALGGALCPQCLRFSSRILPLIVLKILRFIQRTDWNSLPVMRIDPAVRSDVEHILRALFTAHFEHSLRSWQLLDECRRA